MTIHPRNQALKDEILSAPYVICVERARFVTEAYRATEGQPPALRAAHALAHTLANVTVEIGPHDAVAGWRASRPVAAVLPVERGDINTVLELEMDFLTNRESQPFHISASDRALLIDDILPYWRGKSVRDHKKRLWKKNGLHLRPSFGPRSLLRRFRGLDLGKLKEVTKVPKLSISYVHRGLDEIAFNNPGFVMNVFDVQGHMILGHKNVLREGFIGVEARAQAELADARRAGDRNGVAWLEAVILSCRAVRDFARRYAVRAANLAVECNDPERREVLQRIAAACRRVPYQPPESFFEAVQAVWLTQVAAMIAYGMTSIFAVGRVDQYLYPYFAADVEAGNITRAEATVLMEELLLKLSCGLLLLPYVGKRTSSELGSDSASVTIGGVDRDGNDAVNELSRVILDAFVNVKSTGNSFTIRLSEKSPPEFWRRAMETYRTTSGAALFYDEAAVPALEQCGVAPADARDYGVIGCVEPTGDGDTFGCTSGNDISLVGALEMALFNGELRMMGKTVGPRTGDPRGFRSFDDFMAAFKSQMCFMIDTVAKAVNLKDEVYREHYPNPLVSSTLKGCVEARRDMTDGGAHYNFGSISARGLGTVANSLAAIKHFVFDRGTISMSHLLTMLDHNFDGYDKVHAMLAYRGPKYGCDDAEADAIAKEVAEFFCREVAARQTQRGGPFRPGFFSYGMHVLEGLFLGATPDGRRAGEPISNSFSPANGSERQGPTAMLRSIAKIDHRLISNGCAVNVKFLPALFATDERLDKMTALVRAFFAEGGMELQPNVIDNETLRDAQKHPDKYRDLVIRVSGYSAYFTDLGRPLQDEIISRTSFGNL
ncbi:MAG: pyruvate formate lyase family protein [Candidatus Lernaella stagnicola]|nr:pyruvate formate lyase family protein [Candidatus Lernaella stagnicola]